MKKVSIVIPVYNERNTIAEIVKSVESAPVLGLEKEIVIVDDCSTDGTRAVLSKLRDRHRVFYHETNGGKGVALRRGFQEATGDIIITQDADLEYDPANYESLLQPIIQGRADVVYGSRFISSEPRRMIYFTNYVANKVLTFISNMLTNVNLSDMETGYKVMTRDVLDYIMPQLSADRFGIEPEITTAVTKNKEFRIYEVGIAYYARSYAEGKKISWKDGVAALWHIIRFNLRRY
jgi:glycosyltransferase involved in cell wall biosynthesis